MELGNMCFGNSRGEFEFPREWQDRFHLLLEDAGFDGYGYRAGNSGTIWQNDTFLVMPYYWGDCTCGYDDLEASWSAANKHTENCYMSDYKTLTDWFEELGLKEYGKDSIKCKEKRMMLCAAHGIDWNDGFGSAMHCTCDYKRKWEEFASKNGHTDSCMLTKPNFLHKPSGLSIKWYKYPLRDAYMNKAISKDQFKKIIADCIRSVASGLEYPEPQIDDGIKDHAHTDDWTRR